MAEAPGAWAPLLVAAAALLGCQDDDALKAALTPKEGQSVSFYRIGSLRCPYWIPAFQAADGQKGGYQCVNRVVLRKICAIAACSQQSGTPSDLPPSLIDRSKGGPGWKVDEPAKP